MMQLNVTRSEREGWTVVAADGEIDIASAPILDDELADAVDAGAKKVAIDLTPTGFMDSTGLRSLISVHRKLEDVGGALYVIPGSGPVRRLLEVAGVIDTLNVVASVEELPPA